MGTAQVQTCFCKICKFYRINHPQKFRNRAIQALPDKSIQQASTPKKLGIGHASEVYQAKSGTEPSFFSGNLLRNFYQKILRDKKSRQTSASQCLGIIQGRCSDII